MGPLLHVDDREGQPKDCDSRLIVDERLFDGSLQADTKRSLTVPLR